MVTIENCGMPSAQNTGQFGWVIMHLITAGVAFWLTRYAKALSYMAPW